LFGYRTATELKTHLTPAVIKRFWVMYYDIRQHKNGSVYIVFAKQKEEKKQLTRGCIKHVIIDMDTVSNHQ
jgi:hypothetical protein